MKIESTLSKLFSLHQFAIKLGLESTFNILNEIGNPHHNLKCFHIAGSNGKGSTSSFIASILMELGFKVGLYTSPHFVRFNERIKVNGQEILDEEIIEFVSRLEKYIDKNNPTFFEITTALAFYYFDKQKVDYAVIETGLGGRLDATNIIDPLASVITSISLEHMEQLGNTIEKIAFEKAGIIKTNRPVFVGKIKLQALEVIEKRAQELGSKFYMLSASSISGYKSISLNTIKGLFNIYETPLKGNYQLANAALAVLTVANTIKDFNPVSISRGINNIIKNTKIEGRYEVFCEKPKVIFDSAHNPEGIISFLSEFQNEYTKYNKRVLIFGAMRDKNIKEMLTSLAPFFDIIYITSISENRAAKFDEIVNIFNESKITIQNLSNPGHFIKNFISKEESSCLVVIGSMYLLGEIKSKILEK